LLRQNAIANREALLLDFSSKCEFAAHSAILQAASVPYLSEAP
jgi:hypothetical protein